MCKILSDVSVDSNGFWYSQRANFNANRTNETENYDFQIINSTKLILTRDNCFKNVKEVLNIDA